MKTYWGMEVNLHVLPKSVEIKYVFRFLSVRNESYIPTDQEVGGGGGEASVCLNLCRRRKAVLYFKSNPVHPTSSATCSQLVDIILNHKIVSTKSPSFCMTIFSTSLTNINTRLPQSRDYSCNVSRPILAPPPLWLQKHTDLRAHDFAYSIDFWRQHRLDKVTCAWSRRHCGINPTMQVSHFSLLL
jgi:hypothetical protein